LIEISSRDSAVAAQRLQRRWFGAVNRSVERGGMMKVVFERPLNAVDPVS
jgi:hypothetical protein